MFNSGRKCKDPLGTTTGDHSEQDQILLVKLAKYIPGRFLYGP